MTKSGYEDHKERVSREGPRIVPCAVITISDTRTVDTDTSGQAIVTSLEKKGHRVVYRDVVTDDPEGIARAIEQAVNANCAAVILNGGTGIAKRDSTFEVVDGLLEKHLPGFGELFRMLSFGEIGAAAMLSRATAGVYRGMLLFSLPGSTNAVTLAMERLIAPELAHMVWETVRK